MSKIIRATIPVFFFILLGCKEDPMQNGKCEKCEYFFQKFDEDPGLYESNSVDMKFNSVWYLERYSEDKMKYSGPLGLYSSKHRPNAIYDEVSHKTFYTMGLSDSLNQYLYHGIGYYDHTTKETHGPKILLRRIVKDAHENPVISLDDEGYIWIFSPSHGNRTKSYIHRSLDPQSIDSFINVNPRIDLVSTSVRFNNFSYPQVWHQRGEFFFQFTKYLDGRRVPLYTKSKDGVYWEKPNLIADFYQGNYMISFATDLQISIAFNHIEDEFVNSRRNLYFIKSDDMGLTWYNYQNEKVDLPIRKPKNGALIYQSDISKNLYLKDISSVNEQTIIGYLESSSADPCDTDVSRRMSISKISKSNIVYQLVGYADHNYDNMAFYNDGKSIEIFTSALNESNLGYTGGEFRSYSTSTSQIQLNEHDYLNKSFSSHFVYIKPVKNGLTELKALTIAGNPRYKSESNLIYIQGTQLSSITE